MLADLCVVMVSVGSAEDADALALRLVGDRVAACVQTFPIRSTYTWDGEVQRDDEVLLLVKTAADRVERVRAIVHEMHDYDVPEVLALQVSEADQEYARWVVASTRDQDVSPGQVT
jgi:periplasmic divalent cation tolerance protein